MQAIGYEASLLIGISLGLIGGGNSILTIPVLVYLFMVSPTLANSYSPFIVGFTSAAGAYNNYRKGLANVKTVVLFGSSSIITVFIARKFILPFLPDVFFTVGKFRITLALFVIVVFALLMFGGFLFHDKEQTSTCRLRNACQTLYAGGAWVLIGLVTGFLSAGVGFC